MQHDVSDQLDRDNNTAVATESPALFILIGSRIDGPDRLVVETRGQYSGTLASAQRRARTTARALRNRFGVAACADLTDATGFPVYSFTAGGAR